MAINFNQIIGSKKPTFVKYWRDSAGNFSLIFAIAILPILMAIGMAVDISRQIQGATKLQDALDSAALYAAGAQFDNLDDLQENTEAIFEINIQDLNFELEDFELSVNDDGSFSVEASGEMDTMFMQVGGFPNMGIGADSLAVAKTDSGIEIAIAFDTTASMGFGNSWQNATATLEDVLTKIESYTGQAGFYVSLVPFADRVRIGTDKASWLSGPAPAGWNGCVEPREENEGGFQWSSDADTPDAEPFTASIPGVTGGLSAAFGGWGPICPSVPLTGPTSDVSAIVSAANSMSTGGTGRFDDAIAWAWRLLTDEWQGIWGPADYPASIDQRRKIAIFVTDGRTEAYSFEMSEERDWGFNQGSEVGFEHMVHVCERMKAEGIEIYAFRVSGNMRAASYMQACATDADHYMVINSNADLEVAFLDVLGSVKTDLHIVR